MAKLKNLSVSFLSLVSKPATGKSLTLKFAKPDQRVGTFDIAKMDGDRMVAFGIVYAPEQTDAHGEYADAKTIQRAAYEFMREARLKNIDTEHSFTSEQAYVAESWIVRKGDALFADEPVGSWAVGIQVGDPHIWDQLKKGELTGISLAGLAQVEADEDDPAPTQKVGKEAEGLLSKLKQLITGKEAEMDKDGVREIVRSEVGSAVTEALKEAGVIKPEPTQAEVVEAAVAKALEEAGVKPKADDPDAATVEAAVAKALKEAGVEPKQKAAEQPDGGKEGASDFDTKIADAVTKALAKGVTESGAGADEVEETFV